MSPGFFFRTLLRESRGSRGRLLFFIACLAVGVSAVVAVAGLSASMNDGIRREARQLLAADLVIRGGQPIPEDLGRALAPFPGTQRTDVRETVTVASVALRGGKGSRPGPSQLVEMKVVDGTYPFYGKLELSPSRPLAELLTPRTAVVASELLARLGRRVGEDINIGGQPFRVAGIVVSEPDRVGISLTMGPRVFISGAGFGRTTLDERGSRIGYRALFRLPDDTSAAGLASAAERLRESFPKDFYRVETYRQAQPALRENLERVERFLGLVALLSLFVGGIGVAQSVRAWLAGRLDAIAVLKCLGLRPRELFPLYLGQTLLMGLAGSLVGILAGAAVQLVLPRLFPDLMPADMIDPWQPAALLRGLALGVGVALVFSLPPLSAVLRVPPARVLRRDAEPLPHHRWVTAATVAVLGLGVWGMATLQSGSPLLGGQFTGGVAVVTAALAGAAFLVTRLVRRIPRDVFPGFPPRASLWLRQGLAALARPGAGAGSAIVALGLGVLVVLGMSLVERRLASQLSAEIPTDAPSAFLVDIQPSQWPGVERILRQGGAEGIESVPVVMARVSAIDGVPSQELLARPSDREGGRRWALTREQRLTYMRALPEDNRIIEGALWSDPQRAEVSVEQEFAGDIGVRVGSTMRFDIQGVPIDVVVTSLRTVDWQTFGINFFLVVEPGVLEQAPQQRLAVARLPPASEQRVQDQVAAAYPNVTLLRIREILEKVLKVLGRISLGIRFLGGFTVVAGIAILAGAISAGTARRGREVALLKTLGMTRRGVAAAFAVEYALIGLVAGTIGTVGGTALAWGVVTRGFEIPWKLDPLALTLTLAASVALAVIAGLAASFRALERRPIEVLRAE